MKTRFPFSFVAAGLLTLGVLPGTAQDAVTTLAGRAQVSGLVNGTATNALFSQPAALAADPAGNLYVADSRNHVIRKITAAGTVSTFAGQSGVAGNANGTGTAAQFDTPSGLAVDSAGNLLVADTGNSTLRKITPTGVVTTLAGIPGNSGTADGPAATAQFNAPLALLIATGGTIYVADTGNHCLRTLNPVTGTVGTFAGRPGVWGTNDATGTNALFNGPVALAQDLRGNLYVSDTYNNTIRRIMTNAVVTTFAGAPGQDGATDGPLAAARFRSPAGLAFDTHGNLFLADSFNQTIRQIDPAGQVTTISGTLATPGPDDGLNRTAKYYNPYGVFVATNGSLLLTDAYNQTLRQLLPPFALAIQPVTSTGSGANPAVNLTWPAIIGHTYQVQFRNTLSTSWQDLGNPVTAGNSQLTTTDASGNRSRVYRVVQVN